jgi:hypothetical protein
MLKPEPAARYRPTTSPSPDSRSAGRPTGLASQVNHPVVDMSTTLTIKQYSTTQQPTQDNGELVILVDGRLSFDALQRRLVTAPSKARALVAAAPASYVAFDLLAIGGIDLRTQRWTVRRGRLEQLAARWALPLQLSPVTATSRRPGSGSTCSPGRWASRAWS